MLIALDEKNDYIHASSIDKDSESYVCPGCRKPVFLKKGTFRIPHFSHYKNSECSVFSEGETAEHMQGKQLLYDWLSRSDIPVQMEAYLPELKQRPDLLCWMRDGTPVAIEFQCSRLSSDRMLERTIGYREKGYQVVWILGKDFFLGNYFTSFQKLFLMEVEENIVVFLQMDVAKKEIQLAYEFSFRSGTKSLEFEKKRICLSVPLSSFFVEFNRSFNKKKRSKELNLLAIQGKLYQKRLYKDKEVLTLLREMYVKGDSLMSLPIEVYFPVSGEWMIETLSFRWKYALLIWLEKKPIGSLFHAKEVEEFIHTLSYQKRLLFCVSPLINASTFRLPIYEFFYLLCQRGMLAQISQHEWIVNHHPRHFTNEEVKKEALLYRS